MKSKKRQKRLQLSTETLRSLQSDEVQNVVGGVEGAGGPFQSLTLTGPLPNCGCCK